MNKYIKKNFMFVMVLLIQSSCNYKSDFEKNLIENENSIWSIRAIEKDEYTFLGQHVKLWENGKFEFYYSNDDKAIGNEFTSIDICKKDAIIERIWSFIEDDSTFSLGIPEETYKVISYSKDTILLKGKGFEGRFVWVKIHPFDSDNLKK